jgi:hypothetical protein
MLSPSVRTATRFGNLAVAGSGSLVVDAGKHHAGLRETAFRATNNRPQRIEQCGVLARHTFPVAPLAFG